jgi:hypothetical protein
MKDHAMRKFLIPAVAAFIGAASQAQAGPIYDPTVSTCQGLNCSSIVLGGTLFAVGSGSAGQWVQEVFAGAGQCVRLQVLNSGIDLAMTVVAPNGAIYENDQGGGSCFNCPTVKIGSAPKTGWYSVNIAQYLGNPAEGSFTLAYGVYPRGNPNCSSPTPPLSTAATAPASATSSRPANVPPSYAPPLR